MSIKVDGRVYENVSRKYDEMIFPVLVTYTVDGEPSAPLYTISRFSSRDVVDFLADTEGGTVRNIRFWKIHTETDVTLERMSG